MALFFLFFLQIQTLAWLLVLASPWFVGDDAVAMIGRCNNVLATNLTVINGHGIRSVDGWRTNEMKRNDCSECHGHE